MVQVHVLQQFVLLAAVVADLIDDETRPSLNLLGQLEILRHDFAFMTLEIRDDGTGKERGVSLGQQADQSHGIGIEYGSGLSFKTGNGKITRKGEHVMKASAGQSPTAAFKRIAVPVLTGKMDDNFLTARDQVGSHGVGAQHGVSAWVVSDA